MPRRGQGPRLRFLKKRGYYYIVWSERGRSRERSTGTRDSAEAEVALADFLRERSRTIGPRDPSQILITDVLADYAEQRGPEVATPERIAYAIEPLSRFWESRPLCEVSVETCRAYGAWRSRAPGTLRRELGVLRAAIGYAHSTGCITRPVPVMLPDKPEPRDRWLTRVEAAALLNAARTSVKAGRYLPLFVLMGLYTGQRKEAILSLRWSQVDLDKGVIDFNPVGRRRTKKRRPKVRIARRLLPHLRRARRFGSDLGPVLHIDGRPIGDVKKSFQAACMRAGLQGVTPHVLRHTAATWLMQHGVSMWSAAGFLGMSVETLQRVYGHHHPDFQKDAAEAF